MPYAKKSDSKKRNRRYYRAHMAAIKAYAKKWFLENEEKSVALNKKWQQENVDKVRHYKKEWKKRNHEKVLSAERARKKAKRLRGKFGLQKPNPREVATKLLAKADSQLKQIRYGIEGKFNLERR